MQLSKKKKMMFFSSKFFQCKTFYNFLQNIICSIPARQTFTHTPDLMLQSCLESPCSSWIQSEEGFCKQYNNRTKVFTQEISSVNTSKSEYFYMDKYMCQLKFNEIVENIKRSYCNPYSQFIATKYQLKKNKLFAQQYTMHDIMWMNGYF